MSDIEPANVTLPGEHGDVDPYDDDVPELSEAPSRREREGLPPGYRMRADAHYVEQLSSRRGDRMTERGDDEPGTVNEAARDRERLRARIAARLAEDLATIGSAAQLLAGDASPMARRLNTDLIRAEAWRASWLLRAQALLDGEYRGQLRPRQLSTMLEGLRQGFAPECRTSGIGLQLAASDWNAAVAVDEPALMAGLTGAILATLGLVGRVEGAAVTVTVEALAGDLRTVEVAQDDVAVPTSASLRFFDPFWAERPGGWLAGLGAATAKLVAQQYGGNAVLLVGDRRGTVVRMTFARGF